MGYSSWQVDNSKFSELTRNKRVVESKTLHYFYNSVDPLDIVKVFETDKSNGRVIVELLNNDFVIFEK